MGDSGFDQDPVPGTANDSWRTWLMTGVRRPPVDRRRVRGAHKGLKKMLIEGRHVSSEQPYKWKEFSDALVRQSVGDAVHELVPEDAQVVKLAYFGGQSNAQIGERLGLTAAVVARRLRKAVDRISDHVEHGKTLGGRALGALVAAVSGRWLSDASRHAIPAGAAMAAAAIIAVTPGTFDRTPPDGPVAPGVHALAAAPEATSTTRAPGVSPPAPDSGPVPALLAPSGPVVPPGVALSVPSLQLPLIPDLHVPGARVPPLTSGVPKPPATVPSIPALRHRILTLI